MKKFLIKHKTVFAITAILLLWRLYLLILETIRYYFPFRYGYLGFIPQANFDGVYYLAISQYWYRGLDQAFFPFFPITVWMFGNIFLVSPSSAGIITTILSLFLLLLVLYKLMEFDGLKKYAIWSIIFYLSFPTSFFLATIYTESLFIFLVIISFLLARKKYRFLSSITAMLASATRVVGVLLLPALVWEFYTQMRENNDELNKKNMYKYFSAIVLIPLGLLSYMCYLWYKYSDPFLFVHIQPAFGAGRSGGEIILLPQVIYRYIKIFLTIPQSSLVFWISILELSTLILSAILLYFAYKKKIRLSYIIFSSLALIFPTLSGTLSSFPRYILVAFLIYIFLGTIKNVSLKIVLITLGFIVEAILAILFYQGYFIS